MRVANAACIAAWQNYWNYNVGKLDKFLIAVQGYDLANNFDQQLKLLAIKDELQN